MCNAYYPLRMKSILCFSVLLILSPCFIPKTVTEIPIPLDQLTAEIRQIWGKDAPTGIAIATCESGLRQYDAPHHVLHGEANKADVGAFQLNVEAHAKELSATSTDIYQSRGNVTFAKHLFDQSGTKPWAYSKKCWSKLLARNDL